MPKTLFCNLMHDGTLKITMCSIFMRKSKQNKYLRETSVNFGHFVETLLLIGVFHDTIPFFSYFIKEASGLLVSNSSQKNPVLTKEKNFSWFEFYFCKVFIFYLIFMKSKFWLWKYSKFQPKKKTGSYIKFLPIILLETERKFPFCTQGN